MCNAVFGETEALDSCEETTTKVPIISSGKITGYKNVVALKVGCAASCDAECEKESIQVGGLGQL